MIEKKDQIVNIETTISAGEHLLKAKNSFMQFLFMIFLGIFIHTCWNILHIGDFLFIVMLKLFTLEGLYVISMGVILIIALILLIDGIQELGIAGKELKREGPIKQQDFNYKFKYKNTSSKDRGVKENIGENFTENKTS